MRKIWALPLFAALGASCVVAQNTFPSSGKVGIGTTAPSADLEVNGSAQFDGNAKFYGPSTSSTIYQDDYNNRLSISTGNDIILLSNTYTNPVSIHFTRFDGADWRESIVGYTDTSNDLQLQSSGGQVQLVNGTGLYSSGNVGIGTTSPGSKLEVDGNIKLTNGSGASMTFADGTTQSTAWTGTTCGGDYAESVDVAGDRTKYEPGDVLVADPNVSGQFLKSVTPYSTFVSGIYSTKPGLVGRRQLTDRSHMKDEVPMAMTGIVPTKVTTENGPIRIGDLLVTSSKLGYAMKGTDRGQMLGAVVGKALAPLDSETGVIEVLVTLQ